MSDAYRMIGPVEQGLAPTTPAPPRESVDGWLRAAGEVYVQGVMSEFSPGALRTFGGTLKLAAVDCDAIRARNYEGWTAWLTGSYDRQVFRQNARDGWKRHEAAIRGKVSAGMTVEAAALEYYRVAANALPETGKELMHMAVPVARAPGAASAWNWSYDVVRDREIIQDYGTAAHDANLGYLVESARSFVDPPQSMEDLAEATDRINKFDAILNVGSGMFPAESKPQGRPGRYQPQLDPAGPTVEHLDPSLGPRRTAATQEVAPLHTVQLNEPAGGVRGVSPEARGVDQTAEPVPRQKPAVPVPARAVEPASSIPLDDSLPDLRRRTPSGTRVREAEPASAKPATPDEGSAGPIDLTASPAASTQVSDADRGLAGLPPAPAPAATKAGSKAGPAALPAEFTDPPANPGPHDPGRKPEQYFRTPSQVISYLGVQSVADRPEVQRLWEQAVYETAISSQKTAMKQQGTFDRKTKQRRQWVYTPQNAFQSYLEKLVTQGPASPQISKTDVEAAFNEVRTRFNALYREKFGQGKASYDDLHHWNLKHNHPLEAFEPANLFPVLVADHRLIHEIISEGTGNRKTQAERFVR